MESSRNRTILAIGQDLFSIQSYVTAQYNYSLHAYLRRQTESGTGDGGGGALDPSSSPPPARGAAPPAFMVYTDLQSLRGLDRPADYGSGVEYADGILEALAPAAPPPQPPSPPAAAASSAATGTRRGEKKRPRPSSSSSAASARAFAGLQVGLWLNGTEGCRDVVDGRLDAQVARLVSYLSSGGGCASAAASFDRIWVRIGYEFDNPAFGYTGDPGLYRRAFRRIVAACRAVRGCSRRAEFVWHSWAASLPEEEDEEGGGDEGEGDSASLSAFYPGEDVVDWIGVSVFSQLYPDEPGSSRLGNEDTVRAVLRFARRRQKPTMIAESAPFGGIPSRIDPWEAWFRPVLDLIDEYGVGMWSYIHCDWESQPMWHSVGFGDTRLDSNATVLRLWRENVLDNPRFASSPSDWDWRTDPSEAIDAPPPRLTRFQRWSLSGAGDKPVLLVSPLYFLPAIALALLALCSRVWCSPSPLRNPYTGLDYDRRYQSGSSRSVDEVDSRAPEDDPSAPIDLGERLTGYGALATTRSDF